MTKTTKAWLVLFTITLVLVTYYMLQPVNQIVKTITDERGLTSVVFIQDGKEWGLDYLTSRQLDSLETVLKH